MNKLCRWYCTTCRQCTKIEYAVDTVRRASEIPNVIGLKDSSGDLGYLEQVMAGVRHRPDFGVLIGPEEQLVDGLRAGAWGGVNGGAQSVPPVVCRYV